MRVGLDVTPLLGAPTGVAQSLRGLLGALPSAAPEVEVAPYVLSGRAARGGAVEVDGMRARALPLPAGVAVRAWGRIDRPQADRWLGDIDVVHGWNFVVPPMGDVPSVATVHDCWCARHPDRCRPEVVAFSAAVRRAVARGAWLHVTTAHGADEVAEVYGATERVAIVPFGVPTTTIPTKNSGPPGPLPAAVAARPYIVALAALDPRKGLASLVRAFGAVAAGDGEVVLVLAGPDGPARPDIDEAITDLPAGVGRRVLVLGTVDDATRRALVAGARVLAYPSLDEGFGFPVLEAMAAGVPVVCSSAGALPEVTAGAAELVAVGDDDALAGALRRVLVDDVRRDGLVAAGRTRAATFTWERTAQGLAELWRTAVAAGP